MQLEIILLVLSIVANLGLGALVLLRSYRQVYGWLFTGTIFGIALWAVGDIMILAARSPKLLPAAESTFYAAPMVIPVAILLFSLTFVRKKPLSNKLLALILTPALVGIALVLIDPHLLITGVTINDGLNVPHPRKPGFLLYMAHFTIYFVATYIALYMRARKAKGIEKSQFIYMLYGVAIASIPAQITNLSFPLMGRSNMIWLGPIFTLIFVASVTFAIVKHKLFDIRLVIARSLAYLTSLAILATLYGFLVFGSARFIFRLHFSIWAQIFLSIATGIAAITFQRFKVYFDRLTNQLFFRDAYDAQQLFDDLNRVLVSTLDLERLLSQTATIIATNLKSEFCLIGLREVGEKPVRVMGTKRMAFTPADISAVRKITIKLHRTIVQTEELDADQSHLKEILTRNEVAMLVRLSPNAHRAEEGFGYILLGQKKSGNSYNSTDMRVLDTIANELIIAIQNALHFEEIQNFNVTLQEKVDDATHKLRRSNEKLRALDEAKDDFISMASHQLRTPLTSVKGYVSMVMEGDAGKLSVTQKKLLEQAFVSSQRMVFLIADLLNVSRLKTGKFIIEPTSVNLAEVAQQEVDQLVETAESRNLTLTYTKPASFPSLMLDETKTRQVIMNFIDNAIYYTPPGGKINVALTETPASVELRVTDTGIGVPKAEQHHLFTKFYRAGNARQARPDGTGLGLFMAKKVVVAQGGAIIFETQEGKGSTFGFVFSKTKLAPGHVAAAPKPETKTLTPIAKP